jgi:hypothetical protein
MRFFTPDVLERFHSQDAQVVLAAQEELERRGAQYLHSLEQIGPSLPSRFRELLDGFYLHDARVLADASLSGADPASIEHSLRSGSLSFEARRGPTPSCWIPLRLDTPPGEILVLHYRSVEIEDAALHECLFEECPYLEWQHDEVELVRAGEEAELRHSILFTRGFELRLRFKDFDFATLKPMDSGEELGHEAGLIPSVIPE